MTDSLEKTISIKLEIQIPVGANVGVPRINVSQNGPPPVRTFGHTITKPSGDTFATLTGTVCASGKATGAYGPADYVLIKVIQGNTNPGSVPAAGAQRVEVDQITGEWGDVNVSGVDPSSATTDYTLAVWAAWHDGTYTFTSSLFHPKFGYYTDCTYPSGFLKKPAQPCRAAWDLLPAEWHLSTRGFHGNPLSALNGHWTLCLVSSATTSVLYCNGGNISHTPRVQLRCHSPHAEQWELSLEYGSIRVDYRCPASQFATLGQNVFCHPITKGVSEDMGIPATITVAPV